MSKLIYNFSQAWNSISHRPSMILTVVLSLGLTMGSLISAITLNHLLLKEPFPYPEQEKLHVLEHSLYNQKTDLIGNMFTFPGLMELYKNDSIFEESALISYYDEPVRFNDFSTTKNIAYSTPELGSMLDIPMAIGRYFNTTEAINTFIPNAVISYQLWKKEFGLSPDVLKETISIRGVTFQIIGVVSKDFVEPQLMEAGRSTQLWLPWDYESSNDRIKTSWGIIHAPLHFLGKLSNPATSGTIEQQLTTGVNERWQKEVVGEPFFNGWYVEMKLTSLHNFILGENKSVALLLLAASIGLVLICVVNISNLFMSRAGEKRRELAIRVAIGAPRRSVFNIMLFEALCLMGLSLILSIVVVFIEISLIKEYLSNHLPRIHELSINFVSIISAFLISISLAYLFAFVGLKQIDLKSLISMIQSSGKGTSVQVSSLLRKALVVTQVAVVSVMTFVSSILLSDSLSQIYQPQGFNNNDLINVRYTSNASDRPAREESRQFMRTLIEELNKLENVENISQTTSPYTDYAVRAIEVDNTEQKFSPNIKWIDHKYLETIQQPLLFGRNFNTTDIMDNNDIVLINDALAREIGSIEQVVGMQILLNNKNYEIVGIVESISIPNQPASTNRVYMTASDAWNSLLIKLKEDSKLSLETLNSAAYSADRRYSVFTHTEVKTIEYKLLFAQIVTAITTSFLTVLLVILSYVGLYSIMHYNTQLRRFELATRLAIGAKKLNIISMFLRENLSLFILGLAVSSALTIVLLNLNFAMFANLSLNSVLSTYALSTLPVLIIVLASCYFPLRSYFRKPICSSLRPQEETTS